ncbi:MAG: protein kinase [Halobacteriales archaeon]|nr:protein kinase [Halobacteriales archaeon]
MGERSRDHRSLAPALLLALLLCAPAARGDWLQLAYDAGRTGEANQAGPEWGDISYVRSTTLFEDMLAVVGHQAYFVARSSPASPAARFVWSMHLETGVMQRFLDAPRPGMRGASDGSRLFLVADGGHAEAYDLATRALVWAADVGAGTPVAARAGQGVPSMTCAAPAVWNGTLFVVCVAPLAAAAVITVQALEAATGRLAWNWTAETDGTTAPGQVAGGLGAPVSPGPIIPVGISVAAGWVVAVTAAQVAVSAASPVTGYYWDAWVLYPENGTAPGEQEPSFSPLPGPSEPRFGHHPTTAGFRNDPSPHEPGLVTGDDRVLAFKNDPHEHPSSTAPPGERLLTLYTPALIHALEMPLANTSQPPDDGSPLVLSNGSIFAAAGTNLWRVDERLNVAWHQELPPDRSFPGSYAFVAQDRLYVVSRDAAFHDTLEARDTRDGRVLWSQLFDGPYPAVMLADGLLVVVMYSTFFVLGRTSLSLQPEVAVSDASPTAGSRVEVDMARTGPGADGPASAFRADWGDGTVSEWDPSPRLAHTYASAGDFAARFFVRNEARQTASQPMTFHVASQAAPARPAWLASPLASENLPLTLLLVGVVAVGAAGGTGLFLLRRRLARIDPGPAREVGSVAPGALVLGKYRVERELGAGSGGRVFLAQDVRMHRGVVLKTLANRDQAAAIREARAGAAIDHPNVVRVYDVEDLGREALLVMEFVPGGSLKDRIAASGPLAPAAFARVGYDLLAGLAAVHATGSVHRDVKPSNVLLTRDGHAKLSDFGIARLPGFEATMGGAALGSIQYMAPEQARGKRVTPRSDLYSAGATLYEALTGHALVEPLEGENPVEMQMRVGAGRPFDDPALPAALRAWFAKAIAPVPEDRFASAEEMRAALDAAIGAG